MGAEPVVDGMNRMRRVLVFPGGTEIGLEIHGSLRHCRNVELHAAGADVWSHARYVFRDYHVVADVGEECWHEQLQDLCRRMQIDYIYPAHDDVIVALARQPQGLPVIIAPSREACEITRSKRATYDALRGIVDVPELYEPDDGFDAFPVFIKPDRGQGARGAKRIDSQQALELAILETRDPIVCEYLPGAEYTVDCFSCQEQGLLFAQARRRKVTRNGISVNSVTVDLPEAWDWAVRIQRKLGLRGAWFFQLKRAGNGSCKLLEVAPRIAGAMAVHRVCGVNFPLLSILEREGGSLRICRNKGQVEVSRSLSNRYRHQISFDEVIVDLDDTLIISGRVNVQLVAFLFNCVNVGKRTVLLTRHAGDLSATLRKHRLSELFDQIIHVSDGTKKSAHVAPQRAIFVDDSFSERMDMMSVHGIPSFDCSMLELLSGQAENLWFDEAR